MNHIDIIQDTRLDDAHPVRATEAVAISKDSRAAVTAEGAGDGLAAVGGLGDFLKAFAPGSDVKLLLGDDDVVRV